MTAFVRKVAEDAVLREDWHENEDGSRLLLLKYPLLERTGIVEHCFTTRLGGVSADIFSTMNLSFTRGDEEAAVRENYRRLARALGAEVGQFVCSDQTHTVNVRRVTAADAGKGLTRERDYRDVDGLITDEPGLVLSTFYADCVPLYVVDPVHRAIGMSHSGWRGTAARMGAVTLSAMQEAYGTRPEDVVCAVGPSICKDCYVKVAFLFGVFGLDFTTEKAILAIVVAVFSSVAMSGIPGGGGTGELVVCTIFFPDQLAVAYPIALAIGNLVDPPATMVNSAGDYVVSFIVSRYVDGKDWLQKAFAKKKENAAIEQ